MIIRRAFLIFMVLLLSGVPAMTGQAPTQSINLLIPIR